MISPSFTKRLIATIFDLALINVLVIFIGDAVLIYTGNKMDPDVLAVTLDAIQVGGNVAPEDMQKVMNMGVIYSVLSVVLVLLIDAVLPATKWMGSPGKKLLNLAIVTPDGKPIGFGQSLARHAAKFISAITVVGLFMPIWTKDKQSLHDRLTRTMVVKKKSLEAV